MFLCEVEPLFPVVIESSVSIVVDALLQVALVHILQTMLGRLCELPAGCEGEKKVRATDTHC